MANKKIAPRGKAGTPKLKTVADLPKPARTPPKMKAMPKMPLPAPPVTPNNIPTMPSMAPGAMKQQIPNVFPGVKGR